MSEDKRQALKAQTKASLDALLSPGHTTVVEQWQLRIEALEMRVAQQSVELDELRATFEQQSNYLDRIIRQIGGLAPDHNSGAEPVLIDGFPEQLPRTRQQTRKLSNG